MVSVLGELGWWTAYLVLTFQPAMIGLPAGGWFTELGLNAVLPWQETIAAGLNLLLWGGGAAPGAAEIFPERMWQGWRC